MVLLHGADARKLAATLAHDALYPRAKELVTFIGNHDNERFMGEEGASVQKLDAAASLLIALRGIPQIYSGDEIAMPGGGDPDNRRDFPGGFPGDPKNAFTTAGRSAEQQEAFAHMQKLLRLRKEHKALQDGDEADLAATQTSFAFMRSSGSDRVLVVLNSGTTPQTVHIATPETPLAGLHGLTPLDNAGDAQVANDSIDVSVPASTVAIYAVN